MWVGPHTSKNKSSNIWANLLGLGRWRRAWALAQEQGTQGKWFTEPGKLKWVKTNRVISFEGRPRRLCHGGVEDGDQGDETEDEVACNDGDGCKLSCQTYRPFSTGPLETLFL